MFTLANPRNPDDLFLISNSGMPEWPYLLRGTRSILESSWHILHSGTLGPMFEAGRRRAELRDENVVEWNYLGDLRKLLESTVSDQTRLNIYIAAAEELEKSFGVYYNHEEDFDGTDIFIWLFRASDEYFALLRDKVPEALSILAYSCVLMKKLEKNWWMEGWSTHMLETVYYALDEEHRLWIQWPIEEMGWVPTKGIPGNRIPDRVMSG